MNLSGIAVVTISFFIDFQLDYPLLSWIDFHCKLVLELFPKHIHKLFLFQSNILTDIIVICRFIGVMVIDITSYRSSCSFYLGIFGVFIDSVLLSKLFMKQDYLVEQRVYLKLLSVFYHIDWMLSIEVYY